MSHLFLAIWPSPEVHEHIVKVQSDLQERIERQGVRFVRPDKIHLTLRFFGDHAEAGPLVERLTTISSEPLHLSTTQIGAFPGLQRPRVVWLGVAGDGLEALAASADEAVKGLAPDDSDAFAPHFTLARINPGSKVVGRVLQNLPASFTDPPMTWTVDSVALVETLPAGDYSIVERIALMGPKA